MKASDSSPKLAHYLSLAIAFILVELPFNALLVTWIGSDSGHLDLLRIWKEILIFILAVPALWIAIRTPNLKSWLATSWVFRLFCLYFLVHLALGWYAISNHELGQSAFIYSLI